MPLLLAAMVALAARLFLVVRTQAMIDGDEALVGIQAERILHGELPTYFYAQPYMGSLEAYLAAALFRVFGPSSWALRAVPILLSLALVYLTWRLARALTAPPVPLSHEERGREDAALPDGDLATATADAGGAGPMRNSALLAGLAAFVAAAPPLYDAVAELRTWGGQIEMYVVTLALLLCTVELAQRLRASAGAFELARRWAVLGFFAGLGVWINPLVSYALAACALWLLPPVIERAAPGTWRRVMARLSDRQRARGVRRAAATSSPLAPVFVLSAERSRRGALVPLLGLLPGLLIGGLPAWLYALAHGGENLLIYVSQPSVSPTVSGAAQHGRLFLGAAITARYFSCVAPRALDGGLPAESLALLPLRVLLLLPPVAGILCAAWLVRVRRTTPLRVGLPLLYAGVVTAVFCLGTSAWASTKPCQRDWAGRYAVPLALVEPFLLLALFAAPAAWSALRVHRGRPALTPRALRLGWTLALATLLLGGAVQLGSYATTDATATFQSPYYPHVPGDMQPLLTYLDTHHITAAWCNHWLGNIVTFETDGRTTCADYYDQVALGGLRRPPGTLEAVNATDRPSFILIGQGNRPLLAQELDAQGIPYTLAYLPTSNVTVITPARTVDPATVVPGLAVDYPY
ncbi:MAG TPA: hypothetical protein VFU88_04330 [Ktedonobacterales bacterium]|nr:hypothetical protein [Ktedonobacterales bacterium]